jgi:hypothetical protein
MQWLVRTNGSKRPVLEVDMALSMTDEEAIALDEEFTNGTLSLGDGMGPTMRRRELLRLLDEASANYIITIAELANKTPAQVVGDMVRREIAAKSTITA